MRIKMSEVSAVKWPGRRSTIELEREGEPNEKGQKEGQRSNRSAHLDGATSYLGRTLLGRVAVTEPTLPLWDLPPCRPRPSPTCAFFKCTAVESLLACLEICAAMIRLANNPRWELVRGAETADETYVADQRDGATMTERLLESFLRRLNRSCCRLAGE